MYCNLANYNGWKVHEENGESAQYAFDCCSQNLCNNGTEWPELPDVPVLGQFYTFVIGFLVQWGSESDHLKYGNIWNPNIFKFGFQMVRFSNGRAMAIAIVPTICKLGHSKSRHFCLHFKWFLAKWRPFVQSSYDFWQNSSHLSGFQMVVMYLVANSKTWTGTVF